MIIFAFGLIVYISLFGDYEAKQIKKDYKKLDRMTKAKEDKTIFEIFIDLFEK